MAQQYFLKDIQFLLPIKERVDTLTWLKRQYQEAKRAHYYGFKHIVIAESDSFSMFTDDFIELLEDVNLPFTPARALMLVNLVRYKILPDHLIDKKRKIKEEFILFANSEKPVLLAS